MNDVDLILAIAAALGAGLMAGLFCSFSNFGMKALGRIPPAKGMAAMQSINLVIVNPLFLLVFFGTAMLSLALVVLGLRDLEAAASPWAIAGGAIYVVGCIVVTVTRNVPMNNRLAAVDPDDEASIEVWKDYVVRWTRWNDVRSVACLASTLAFVMAVSRLGRW